MSCLMLPTGVTLFGDSLPRSDSAKPSRWVRCERRSGSTYVSCATSATRLVHSWNGNVLERTIRGYHLCAPSETREKFAAEPHASCVVFLEVGRIWRLAMQGRRQVRLTRREPRSLLRWARVAVAIPVLAA